MEIRGQIQGDFVTIVTYHYVRPIKDSLYPDIKGLELQDFYGQIEYIMKYYEVVSMDDLVASINGQQELPDKALLLSFDDGFVDHYEYVFPYLLERGLSGAFYPSVSSITKCQMLDVHKIHFVLASQDNKVLILDKLNQYINDVKEQYELEDIEIYKHQYCKSNRFDSGEVIYIKRMLQYVLPGVLRSEIIDYLFTKFVTKDQAGFAKELYLSENQIRTMIGEGMHFGGHGLNHEWLNHCSRSHQELILTKNKEFLECLGATNNCMTFSYPYGAYNSDTLEMISRYGFDLAFTTKVGLADLNLVDNFEVPRIDTNDLPISFNAELVNWTRQLL